MKRKSNSELNNFKKVCVQFNKPQLSDGQKLPGMLAGSRKLKTVTRRDQIAFPKALCLGIVGKTAAIFWIRLMFCVKSAR